MRISREPQVARTNTDLSNVIQVELAYSSGTIEDSIRYNLTRLDVAWDQAYSFDTFRSQVFSIRWDVAGAYGLVALIGFGFEDWHRGTATFHFTDEGWFGKNTKYLGMEKLGHAYTGYLFTEYFTQRIAHATEDRAGAALTGTLLGMGLQTYVEILDGFSDNGFLVSGYRI